MWLRRFSKGKDNSNQQSGHSREAVQTSVGELHINTRVMHQLNRLQLTAGRFLPGYTMGLRPSLRRKTSAEFQEHRMYVPGDDIRYVDWKASARQEHIFIKQGQQPKEVTVHLLLDCSASMAWGSPPKSSSLLALAAALGYMALAHGDRLQVVPFSQKEVIPLGPVSGKGQYTGLIKYLRALPFGGKVDIAQSVQKFRRNAVIRGGLTFLLSDLLDVQQFSNTLGLLPAPAWEVTVLHLLHRDELHPDLKGDYEMQDIETGAKINYDITRQAVDNYLIRLELWKKELELACVENNAFYTLIPTHWDMDTDILPHLRNLDIVKSL